MASLTNTIGISKSFLTGAIPSETISFRSASLPARMIFTTSKLRLPFCHTSPTAKDLLTVKVASRSGNIFTTPRAFFGDKIRTPAIRFAYLSLHPTFHRAIFLRPIACMGYILSTLRAISIGGFTPPSQEIALTRAIRSRILSAIFRMERLVTSLTIQGYPYSSHTYIIPQLEREEKYCEIAKKRLSQSVMKLET